MIEATAVADIVASATTTASLSALRTPSSATSMAMPLAAMP